MRVQKLALALALTITTVLGSGAVTTTQSRPASRVKGLREQALGPKAELAKITAELRKIALDELQDSEERRAAVLLIGELGTKEGVEFLVTNVALVVPKIWTWRDGDQALETPCRYALSRGDWAVAQAIFKAMDLEKSKEDLLALSYPLDRILTRSIAVAILKAELERGMKETRRKNLTLLKEYLSN